MAVTTTGGGLTYNQCNKPAGGVLRVWAADQADIDTWTAGGTNHEYTNIVFGSTGVGFELFEAKRNTVIYRVNGEKTESGAHTFTWEIEMAHSGLTEVELVQLEELRKKCELVFVVENRSNQFIVLGYDEVFGSEGFGELNSLASDSGAAVGDANAETMIFGGVMGERPRIITGISGATTPATTDAQIRAELVAATSV